MSAAVHLHPVDRVVDKLRDMGCQPKQSRPGQWNARCPNPNGHKNGDKNPSLSIGTGPDGKALIHCNTGCRLPDIARALDLGLFDLFPDKPQATIGEGRRIVATYDYYDEGGVLVFQVVRYRPKDFRQRKPLDNGSWVWSVADIAERPLYMLPQVRRAVETGKRVYMCEGEKDAEALQWHVTGAATCNSGGSEKWRDEYARQLEGATRITLMQDADAPGLRHVKTFAAKLLLAGFLRVDVLAPPSPHKDVAQALGAGKTLDQFVKVWDQDGDRSWLTIADDADLADPDSDDAHDGELETQEEDDWQPIDLAFIARQIIDGTYKPTMPTIMEVEGALPLFYRERVNLLFGESGGGKTWIALAALAETVRKGERALMIDYEDNPNGIAERLVALGVTLEQMQLIDYINPTRSMSSGWDAMADTPRIYALVVLDSTGEAMAAGGVNSNDDGEVAQWFAIVKRFLRLPGKPAVITLDHVPKNQEGQLLFSIGSQRKRAAITGASYRVDTLKEPAKGKDGKLKLTVAKDRPGNRPKSSVACHIDLISVDGKLEIKAMLEGPSVSADGTFRPTVLMERVSRWLEDHPNATAREVRDGVTGKTVVVTQALAVLVSEGRVSVSAGAKGAQLHHVATPYREAFDTPNSNPGSLVPSGSPWLPGTTDNPSLSGSPVPPLTRGTGNHTESPPENRLNVDSVVPDDSTGSHADSVVPSAREPWDEF